MFDNVFVPLSCPRCGYLTDVELLSIRLQQTIFCSCCKSRIQLMDANASLHRAQNELESAMRDLTRNLKDM